MILQMIDSLADTSSTKQKQELLQSFSNLNIVKDTFAMALDKVKYNYGIRQIPDYVHNPDGTTLAQALAILKELYKVTGHAGRDLLADTLSKLSVNDAEIIKRIIRRDLKCGVGRTMANNIWKNLITKPPYMRCNVFSDKTSKYIKFPAILQEKADGRFLYIIKDGQDVTYVSRQGEEDSFPQLTESFLQLPDGVYVGELLVRGTSNRAEANGILNSDEGTTANVYVHLWDYLSLEDFSVKESKISYSVRFKALVTILSNLPVGRLYLISTIEVRSIQEALTIVGQWMAEGKEGGVLKDYSLPFKDHTSNLQLKLKLEISAEMYCTGFTEGTPGTSREMTFGAMTFSSECGSVVGQTSGFTDTELRTINSNREGCIGKVVEIQFNDISKARGSDTFSLMHPRFMGFRDDKHKANTLKEIIEMRKMVMILGNK